MRRRVSDQLQSSFQAKRFVRDFLNSVPHPHRYRHTYRTLPLHNSTRFGGRTAFLRQMGPINIRFRGTRWKKDHDTVQYNVDIWCAQQTLRKKWKGRDWDVVEVPFEKAPQQVRRVIPELYTEVPVMADPANGDFRNIRSKVFDREDLQDVLYPEGVRPYPAIQRVDRSKATLDKFLR